MSLPLTYCRFAYATLNNIPKHGFYAHRSIVTIEKYKIFWHRPQKITCIDRETSGDLGLDVEVKPTDIKLYYENAKELEDASDIVRKLFTVEFQPSRETENVRRERIMALVKRHICDRGSPESAIAAMTHEIQHLQRYMEKNPRNTKSKVFLKELIENRKQRLKHLRKWDYRCFEWVLERLNLIYRPLPDVLGPVSRKDSLRRITANHCDKIVEDKLDAYKAELKAQQKEFFEEKADKLAFILKEELECGLEPSVTEEEIAAARKKAEEL